MAFPYTEVFLGLLLAYMVSSVWARLDARYPIAAALVLLVVTAVVDAAGEGASANTLAEYVFFLLGAGVVLLLIEHVRKAPDTGTTAGRVGSESPADTVSADPSHPGEGHAEDSLHGVEQEPVPLVHALRDEDQDDEQHGHTQPDGGQGQGVHE